VAQVGLDGLSGQVQLLCDLGVAAAARGELADTQLADVTRSKETAARDKDLLVLPALRLVQERGDATMKR